MRLQPPDQLSIVLMWLSAIFMAIKTGVENWPAANLALPAMSAPWLSFVPLVLLMVVAIGIVPKPLALGGIRGAENDSEGPSDAADILPETIAKDYLALALTRPTELQLRKALSPYRGKWIELQLKAAEILNLGSKIKAQLYVENGSQRSDALWAAFSPKWEDHLHSVGANDLLRFQARIFIGKDRAPQFVDAIPLPPIFPERPAV